MRTGKRIRLTRAAALILALSLLLSVCLSAQAAGDVTDVNLLLAQNAVDALDLKGADGEKIRPRLAPEKTGRGEPDTAGEEPDYRGVVGYASLQADWDVSRFSSFTSTPWIVPLYEKTADGWRERADDAVRHKSPVLVLDQELREEKGHKFRGCLDVIRLDTMDRAWISVTNFVTVPYWTLGLGESVQYGYSIAVYRDRSRYEPMDKNGHRGTVLDGTRVLMCDKRTSRYFSPDPEHNPLLGVVFRSGEAGDAVYRTFLFFSAEDLIPIY